MRAELLVLAVLLAACGTAARLTRPEGDGGWSQERRGEEIARHVEAEPPPPAPGPLTLADALALAERGNRRIAEAEQTVAGARERVWQARGRLFPSTTGYGRYSWYSDAQMAHVVLPPGLLRGLPPPAVVIREAQVGVVNGTVSLPLDLNGELGAALAAAQAGYRGEQARLWATRLEEQVGVIRAYFDLLSAERLRAVTEETIAAERQQLANAEQRYANGRLTKNELLVVQVTLSNAEQRLLARDLAIDEARWALNQAIGLPVDAGSTVVDVASSPAVPAVDDALQQMRANNPVLVTLLEEQQRLEETRRALVRGWLPRTTAGGAIDYSSSTAVLPQRIGTGFLGFTWDLGTDTRRAAEIAEAGIAADRNQIALDRTLRELEARVRATRRAVEERLAAAEAARVAVVQADENLRIRRQQFDAGRATSTDVLDAVALVAVERATLATALYEAHARRAELQQLIGLPLDDVVADAR
jgi:outer membrane protein TolC